MAARRWAEKRKLLRRLNGLSAAAEAVFASPVLPFHLRHSVGGHFHMDEGQEVDPLTAHHGFALPP